MVMAPAPVTVVRDCRANSACSLRRRGWGGTAGSWAHLQELPCARECPHRGVHPVCSTRIWSFGGSFRGRERGWHRESGTEPSFIRRVTPRAPAATLGRAEPQAPGLPGAGVGSWNQACSGAGAQALGVGCGRPGAECPVPASSFVILRPGESAGVLLGRLRLRPGHVFSESAAEPWLWLVWVQVSPGPQHLVGHSCRPLARAGLRL